MKGKIMKSKMIATVLSVSLLLGCLWSLSSCRRGPGFDVEEFKGNYTYKDSVVQLSSNWNPHTYQTEDESYPIEFLSGGLYSFIYNDALNPVEEKDPYTGYVIMPEMAASMPVDVTESVREEHPEFNIPKSASAGYAYTIELNPDAEWEDGTPINADTYVYSMKQLLDPKLLNYRATDYFSGALCIAGAADYYYQGTTAYTENNILGNYRFDQLVKGEGGVYYSPDGNPMGIAVDFKLETHLDGNTLKAYVDAYGAEYFNMEKWDELYALADKSGVAPLTDESYGYLVSIISTEAWGESREDAPNYFAEGIYYEDNFDFSGVGIYKNDDYGITLVLEKSLAGFQLLYNLTGNWIVYEPYYEECKKQISGTDAYTTTYNTSVGTTMSYGPYKLSSFERDKSMVLVKNENWYGYSDGKHIYEDPVDGKVYPMYQTTRIECQVVPEAETRKLMFLKGQLMTYGLQADDFGEYRDSEFCYVTPSETVFFFIFNGYKDAIDRREAAAGFDKSKIDLETLTLKSFRQAVAVTYNKEDLAVSVSPSRSAGYGLIGNSYIYDPETGARYRDTEQAKKALCDFYSVDVSKFDSLDSAVESITGYDITAARRLYNEAYEEAIKNGYITDSNRDGKSDQTVEILYASSSSSPFITKTLDYLNEKMREVTKGTPFEGRISFRESAPLGNDWSNQLKAGMADTCLAGWSGSALDPFGLTDLYTNPSYQYDAKWFNSATVQATLDVNTAGIDEEEKIESVTMNLRQWSDALNGATVSVNGKEYCFGDGIADVETRLNILAMIESKVLGTYNYIPMLQDAELSLLSKQVYYVTEEYNPVIGRGGIRYLKYNYDDTGWDEYVRGQNGELKY